MKEIVFCVNKKQPFNKPQNAVVLHPSNYIYYFSINSSINEFSRFHCICGCVTYITLQVAVMISCALNATRVSREGACLPVLSGSGIANMASRRQENTKERTSNAGDVSNVDCLLHPELLSREFIQLVLHEVR